MDDIWWAGNGLVTYAMSVAMTFIFANRDSMFIFAVKGVV